MRGYRTDRNPPGYPDWFHVAPCKGKTELFFAHPQQEAEKYREAVAICESCPFREPCLAWALRTKEPEGVWGGKTASQRERMGRRGVA